jgi:hypothetical protein
LHRIGIEGRQEILERQLLLSARLRDARQKLVAGRGCRQTQRVALRGREVAP